ncbi:hypothetical protein [Actinosynnema sp. NPDC023587]|uniref:hypothetical protein n=1 Tax=Actinosynnema sp. NPDC023587 TaxID=3154695 RepID=UPI003408B6C0
MGDRADVDRVRNSGAVIHLLLWVGLGVSGAVNALAPLVGVGYPTRIWAGGVTVACLLLLIVHRRLTATGMPGKDLPAKEFSHAI